MSIKNHFSAYTVSETVKVEKPGFSGFEAELKKGEKTLEVVFSASGEIISQKDEKAADEDKD